MNNISLTIRLPEKLNLELTKVSKELGMTKSNLIRAAIHGFLTSDEAALDFSLPYDSSPKFRMVLIVNQHTYDILIKASEKYSQSINIIVTAIIYLALERGIKWLS
ncbi:MAG: hypothetical protein ACRC3H_07280 [Lachnospiraceae bacterium]